MFNVFAFLSLLSFMIFPLVTLFLSKANLSLYLNIPPKKHAVPTSGLQKENTFWLFEVFSKHMADVKDEMTFVIERKSRTYSAGKKP